MAHTPTPWKYLDYAVVSDKINEYGNFIVVEAPARNEDIDQDNLKFIVRAVNSHDELLEACNSAIVWFEAFSKENKIEPEMFYPYINIKRAILRAEGKA
jgi:hypothetical protein